MLRRRPCVIALHLGQHYLSLSRLNDLLEYFAKEAKTITSDIVSKYELLGGRWIADPRKRLEEVLSVNKIAMISNVKFDTVNSILNNVMNEANMVNLGYEGNVNDFLIYNGINRYLNDNDLNIAVPEVRREKDSKIFEYMLANA